MRKMNSLKILALGAVAALASCSQVDDFNIAEQANNESNAISFGTYMGKNKDTRAGYAGGITTDVLKDAAKANGFGVFAYYTGANDYAYSAVTTDGTTGQSSVKPNFMYNEHVTWSTSRATVGGYISNWTYEPLKYWPNEVQDDAVDNQTDPATSSGTNGGKVSFFAYAPYVASASGSNGITAMTANSVASDPILTYVVASDGKDVVDLLWGTLNTASANVVGGANSGVTYNASGTNYQKSILESYTVNADLTKQKTNGKVDFAFKHALAKVGGSTVTTSPATTNGLMIQLDLDNERGAITGGIKADATKVTVKSIEIKTKAKSAATGTNVYYQTTQAGKFNLANGQWQITSTTGDAATAATTTHTINQSGTGASGTLADAIKEPDTWNATWASNPAGVTTTAQNVYASEAAPLVFIPGTYPELEITIDYFVRTEDTKLEGGYSVVEQVIKKTLTFAEAVKLNKQYNILIHLGLTSVKFDATVSDWDPDVDGDGTVEPNGDDKQDVHVPINVL